MYSLRRQNGEGAETVVYPNGLSLMLRRDERVPVAAARCYVRGGSISEESPGGRGVAHLLEHLIATAAAAAMERHADGALLNAFTTHDYTCFHWSALEEDAASSVRQFFAGLRRAAALDVDVDAEKKVVLQEIELFREKRLALFQQCFAEEMFDVHPLRYPVCGYTHLLRELTAADLEAYLEGIYTGANVRLEVTGAFDEDAVAAAVGEGCASLPPGRRFELAVEEPQRAAERVFVCETDGIRGAYTQAGVRFAALPENIDALRRELGGELTARSVTSEFGAGFFSLLAHHREDDGPRVEETLRRWLAENVDLTPGNLTIGTLRRKSPLPARGERARVRGPVETTLANGTKLLILPTPGDEASCQLLWRGGVLAETTETNGLWSLMARVLPTLGKTNDVFGFCDENFCGVSADAGQIDGLAAIALRPAFDRTLVEEERDRTAAWLTTSRGTWLTDLQSELKRLLYVRHPYRLSEIGTPDSLPRLTLEDVMRCHAQTCVGGNTAIAVSGRVDAERLRDRLASLFDAIPAGSFTIPVVDEPDEPRTATIGRPWKHGALAAGYRGVPWNEETWGAIELLKALLVGPANDSVRGRLIRAMREEGAAYSVHCLNQTGFGEGYFAVLAACAAGQEERAAEIVARELGRLREGDLTAGELEHCRKLHLLHHLRQYESPRGHAYAAARQILFSTRSWTAAADELRRPRVEDVVAAARLVFDDRRRAVVLVRPEGGSQ